MEVRIRQGELGLESESFFRTLVEMVPQMVWTKNADGVNDYCNRRFRDYMGLTVDEFRDNSWIVAHPDDVALGQSAWRDAKTHGAPYEVELRLRPKTSSDFRWFLVRAVPYRDHSGRVVKWFGSTTDIDAQKRYSEEQRSVVRVLVDLFSPDDLPIVATLRLDAAYVPAENLAQVGGDFYSAIALPDGRLLFSIGDVAGHGLAAAVMMERVRNAIVTASLGSHDPASVLLHVNRVLSLRRQLPFVTALVGFLDPALGTFTYASAGHPGPVLVAAGGLSARLLPHGGFPLGVGDDPQFAVVEGVIAPGEMLVLYTDGITEFDRDIDAGERLLLAAAAGCLRDREVAPAQAIVDEVLGGAQPVDDVALLTISFGGARATD
jgi:PAS domain S-box-containing protein